MRTTLVPIGLVGLALLGSGGGAVAHAGPLEGVRSREPLPAREVERPIASPRGWSELHGGLSSRVGGDLRLDDRRLSLDHGLTSRLEGRVALSHRTHRGPDQQTAGLADPMLAVRWTAVDAPQAGRWLTVETGLRSPLGQGHPNPEIALPIAAPTAEGHLELIARQRVGALRVDLGIRGAVALPGWTGTGTRPNICSTGWNVPLAWMDGGGSYEGFAAGLLQAGPLQVRARVAGGASSSRRVLAFRLGDATIPVIGCIDGPGPVLDASGWVDGQVGGAVQVSRGLQLDGWVQLPVAGAGRRFQLVDHGPGRTVGGGVEVAW